MFVRTAWVFCCILFVGATWATADDNTAANKIFVETVQLLNQAATAKPSEAIGLYEQALRNLDRIVAEYSSSNLAVQLASSQPIGQVSRAGIEKALGKAKCYQNPVASCVLAEALEIARDMTGEVNRTGTPDAARLDPFRLRALTAIAGAQAKAGDAQEASKVLTDTLEIARNIKGEAPRGWLLAAIAEAQAKAGNLREALDLARNIKDDLWRAEAFRAIVEVQAKAGNLREALDLTRNIKDDLWRARALRAIVEAQAKAGNIRDALETARSIKNDYSRTEALSAAMIAQVKAGDAPEAAKLLAEALETARNIKEDGLRAGALRVIARAQMKVGDVREATKTLVEALETSHNIKEDLSRSGALSAIAEAQARSGDVRDALETVRRIEDGTLRAWVLAILTETLVDMGVK
jgi:tetratricopeptide (TPR) repeat protein